MRVTAPSDSREYPGVNSPEIRRPDLFRPRRVPARARRRRSGPLARALACSPGHRRATSQVGWLHDVREHPDLQLLRGDARQNVLEVAGVLAAFMDWSTSTSRPTWAVLGERTGLARRSVARHLAWLRAAGLLGIVEHGTTPALSPGVLRCGPDGEPANGTGNTASVYVLIAPVGLRLVAVQRPEDVGVEWVDAGPVDAVEAASWRHDGTENVTQDEAGDAQLEHGATARGVAGRAGRLELVEVSGTPSRSRRELDPPVRAHEVSNLHDPALRRSEPAWPGPRRPATRPERAEAALEARRRVPDLARLSTPYVGALLREWFLAGWTLADVLAALQRPPTGPAHRHTVAVRHVPGWVRSRLAHWRTDSADPTSPPGPSPSARGEADRVHAAATARARAEREAAALAPHAPSTDAGGALGEDAAAAIAARGVAGARAALRVARAARAVQPVEFNQPVELDGRDGLDGR